MPYLLSLLKKKWVIWLLLTLPICWILTSSFPMNHYKFWSRSLMISGYTAVGSFVFCLALNPLATLFPTLDLLKVLNRRRREIGLTSFNYACIHFLSYLTKKGLKTGEIPWKTLLKPMVLPAVGALFFLFIIAFVSNDYAIRRLGYTKWKKIQQLAYLVEVLIFLHLVQQSGIVFFWAFALFIPLLILQWVRFRK